MSAPSPHFGQGSSNVPALGAAGDPAMRGAVSGAMGGAANGAAEASPAQAPSIVEPSRLPASRIAKPSKRHAAGTQRAAYAGTDPISRPARVWSRKDGNSPAALYLRQVRALLIAHLGGQPNAAQRMAIERAAMLSFHIARMDAEAMAAPAMSDHARREYLAWSNSLIRTLAVLGLDAAPPPPGAAVDRARAALAGGVT